MSAIPWQIDSHFIAAGKALVANVIASGQVIGPFDNTTKVRPRIEVDFLVSEQSDARTLSNLNAVFYHSDFTGTMDVRVVTSHTDANHATYCGQVRRLFACDGSVIQTATNTYYEVQSVLAESEDRERDDSEDELRTAMRYRIGFSVRPW